MHCHRVGIRPRLQAGGQAQLQLLPNNPDPQLQCPKEIAFQETFSPIVLVAPLKASGLESEMKGFVEGVTESMVSAFSTFKGVKVLSSNTIFHTIKQKMTDKEI